MPFRATFNKLIRRDAAPSLRERAAELRASISRTAAPLAEPATADGRAETDALLLALAPEWEAARNAYEAASNQQIAITYAAEADGRPGPAPEGSGPEWQAWFERCREWRERTGIEDAEEASGDACRALGEVEDRIAALPATSVPGLRLKARVAQRCEEIGIEWPDSLGEGLARDLLAFGADGLAGTASANETRPAVQSDADPILAAIAASRQAEAEMVHFAQMAAGRPLPEVDTAREDAIGKTQRATRKAVWTAVPTTAAGRLALVKYAKFQAALIYGDEWRTEALSDMIFGDAFLALAAAIEAERSRPEPSLVEMIDFASASLEDLRSLHDIADLVGGVAYATVWTARCKARGRGDDPNVAGKLMQWLGDALTDVETTAHNEARRRTPSHPMDRETRLQILARPTIQNGSTDETETLARELLAWVQAEREDR